MIGGIRRKNLHIKVLVGKLSEDVGHKWIEAVFELFIYLFKEKIFGVPQGICGGWNSYSDQVVS